MPCACHKRFQRPTTHQPWILNYCMLASSVPFCCAACKQYMCISMLDSMCNSMNSDRLPRRYEACQLMASTKGDHIYCVPRVSQLQNKHSIFLCAGCAALTVACLPRRLWQAQLGRLGLLTGGMFLLTALSADGIPPVVKVCQAIHGLVKGLLLRSEQVCSETAFRL